MKKLLAVLLLINAYTLTNAQSWTYEKDKDVKNLKATIQLMNGGEMAVIVPDDNEAGRYVSEQLPKEYRVEGLKVTINGYTGKIPPYVRMMGTPLYITQIWISKADRKKYKLNKCKYTFK